MIDLDYLPNWFTFFLCIGTILGSFFDINGFLIIVAIGLGFGGLIYSHFKSNMRLLPLVQFSFFTFIIFILIGILNLKLHEEYILKSHYSKSMGAKNISVLKIDKVLKSNTVFYNYWANVQQINQVNVTGRVLLHIKKDSLSERMMVDDLIYTICEFKEIKAPLNPYAFNYKKYLTNQHIYHQVYLSNQELAQIQNPKRTLKGVAFNIRNRIKRKLNEYDFSKDQLAIINAMLLGQRQDISKEVYNNYKNAGAVHLLAISGLHIGIILILLNFILSPLNNLKHGKRIKVLLLVLLLWSFAFLSGLSASVVRAVTMFTALTIGLSFKKGRNVKNALVISMFVLILFHPFYLFDVGFQLSYSAVFSILFLQPRLVKLYKPRLKPIKYLWSLFTVTIAAQIGVLPLSLYYFNQFPSLFFVSSLVIIPFLGVILGLGFVVLILAYLHILPVFLANIYAFIINGMNVFVAFIANQESFIFQNISISIFTTIALYLIYTLILVYLKSRQIVFLKGALTLIVIIQLNAFFDKFKLETNNHLIVFNEPRETLIAIKEQNQFQIFKSNKDKKFYALISYHNRFEWSNDLEFQQVKNIMKVDDKEMMIIDSSAVYSNHKLQPKIILMRQSPKLNFQRMIETVKPELIIADASNYKSFVKLWKKSAKENGIKFWDTSVNGAFIYDY